MPFVNPLGVILASGKPKMEGWGGGGKQRQINLNPLFLGSKEEDLSEVEITSQTHSLPDFQKS